MTWESHDSEGAEQDLSQDCELQRGGEYPGLRNSPTQLLLTLFSFLS